jgi:hypothetical protein
MDETFLKKVIAEAICGNFSLFGCHSMLDETASSLRRSGP